MTIKAKIESPKDNVKIIFFQNVNSSILEEAWLDSIGVLPEYRQVKIKIFNKWYVVDAFDPNTNTIYEFYGDYWHGNPKIYHPYKVNKQKKKTFGKLYKITVEKENNLKKLGYNVISIWESDWKENRHE